MSEAVGAVLMTGRTKYDVIVVGGGSAGSVVAARLSEDGGRRVLLIEAGPDYPDPASVPEEIRFGRATGAYLATSRHNWAFTGHANPQAPVMAVARGKVIGGTGAINGQIAMRGVPEDFDGWAAMGVPDWSFAKVLPFFRKLETDLDFGGDDHGTSGPIPIRRDARATWSESQAAFYEASRAQGFPDCPDHNATGSTGVGPVPLNNVDGVRMSSAATYLAAARSRPNLTVLADTKVLRIEFSGSAASGVTVRGQLGTEIIGADEIVVSAGAIGSPHLLMLSGIGPAEQLAAVNIEPRQHLPGVGQNLRDHAMATLAWRTRLDNAPAGWIQTSLRYGAEAPNDMKIWFAAVRENLLNSATMPANTECFGPMLMLPESAGSIRLASADPDIQPMLDYQLLQTDGDRRRMREGVRLAIDLATRPQFIGMLGERVKPNDVDLGDDAALDRWLLREIKTGNHVSGTCKMGADDDPMAVTDHVGQVRGVTGLRVADASIMPQVVRASTNIATIMIGERIATFMGANA